MKDIKFLTLSKNAKLPTANGDRAMAFDLYAARDTIVMPGLTLVDLGVVLDPTMYDDFGGFHLYLRSGFSSNASMANGVGLIETSFAGFEKDGEVYGISAKLRTDDGFVIKAGERIAQLEVYSNHGSIIFPSRLEVNEWSEIKYHDREVWYHELGPGAGGRGGFGSTGNR